MCEVKASQDIAQDPREDADGNDEAEHEADGPRSDAAQLHPPCEVLIESYGLREWQLEMAYRVLDESVI